MKNKKIVSILIIIIIVVLGYFIYKKFNDKPAANGQLSDAQIKTLVGKVSKLIAVPDESPVIATIVKADELIAEQKFYAGSKDGDYLLVFPTAQKAIIYRESENKLINVGPIIVDQTKATSTNQQVSNQQDDTKDTTPEKATSTTTSTSTKKN